MEMDPKAKRIYHNEELRQDLKGVVDPQTTMMMAHMDPDKVVDLVQHR